MTIKQIIFDIDKKEWRFFIVIAVFLMVITTLPYIYGYVTAPEDTYFLNISATNRPDYPVYFSYIEQAKAGNILFENLFTSEDQPKIIFHLFFLILGFIAKIFSLSASQVFQLARIILIPVFVFLIYIFLSFLFKEKQIRKIGLILICFSSGIGAWLLPWLIKLFTTGIFMDLWVPEAITFLTLYTHPLFILSLSLIIVIFFLMLLALENKRSLYAIMAGLCGLILFQIHPYHFPTIFLVLILFWLGLCINQKQIHWQFLKYSALFTLISSPSLMYYWWLTSTDWLTIQRISQSTSIHFTPPIWSLFITYGVLWLFAFIGIYRFFKNKQLYTTFLFLLVWLVSHIILIYSPFHFQRRMIEGLHIVISIFAATGIFFLFQKLKIRPHFLWTPVLVFFLAFSNIYVIAKDINSFASPHQSVPQDIIHAMKWLKQNTLDNAVILSTYKSYTGNLIPAFAVRKVYLGHQVETAYSKEKEQKVTWFFSTNNNDAAKYNFLQKNNIDYIFVTIDDQEPDGLQPQEKNYLEKTFENNSVNIYKIL